MSKWNLVVVICALSFIATESVQYVDAKPRSGGFSRSSSSFRSSSSSRSSSFGSSKPRSSYSSGSSSSKSKYSSGSSSSPKSKYSSGSTSTKSNTSKYSSGSTSRPSSASGSSTATTTSKAKANKAAASQRSYQQTKQATAPPRSNYVAKSGKTVNVRKDSKVTKTIRSKPSTAYQPQQRTKRTEVHIHNHGYSHPTSWYYNQPSFYVGGGYSSAFWWMMSEWSAERRARWLYNNQNVIEQAAYERGMKDQAVAAEIAKLKQEKVPVNSDYVDPEFTENPDLMYTQDYVEAAYNPTVVAPKSSSFWTYFWTIVVVLGIVSALFYVATQVRWGK